MPHRSYSSGGSFRSALQRNIGEPRRISIPKSLLPFSRWVSPRLRKFWDAVPIYRLLTVLHLLKALFIGFSFFRAQNTIQGLQNQMYAVMMLFSMFGQLSEQIMPQFVSQREVYETRERPSKIYDWKGIVSLEWQ